MKMNLFLMALAFVSNRASATEYTIASGAHYASPRTIGLFLENEMSFTARFDNTAIYPTQPVATRGVNKLKGFSDCGSYHQVDSARFGWEWHNNQLLIYAYTYVNSQRTTTEMASVPLNVDVSYDIKTADHSYTFAIQYPGFQKTLSVPRGCAGSGGLRYELEPYFGGNEVAPHKITIEVN